jgi:hypothetical protein
LDFNSLALRLAHPLPETQTLFWSVEKSGIAFWVAAATICKSPVSSGRRSHCESVFGRTMVFLNLEAHRLDINQFRPSSGGLVDLLQSLLYRLDRLSNRYCRGTGKACRNGYEKAKKRLERHAFVHDSPCVRIILNNEYAK